MSSPPLATCRHVVEARLAPELAAARFRSRHDLGNAPIRDMVQVMEDFCGAFVLTRPFPSAYEAFTVHDEVSGTTIVAVGTTDNPERQRFTIAHELGHLESGRMSAEIHSLPDPALNADEIWANNFARHLLLPLPALEKFLTDAKRSKGSLGEESLSDMVRVFGISPAAAMIQLHNSGWISESLHAAWRSASPALTSKALSTRHGWSSERSAMVAVSLAPRRPTRVVNAATAAYEAGQTSLESLAQAAGQNDLVAYRATLEESGVTPARPELRDTAGSDDDDWDSEDFSDLSRAEE
jgi:Zn-dependent peptidase ImmA (M78 family)